MAADQEPDSLDASIARENFVVDRHNLFRIQTSTLIPYAKGVVSIRGWNDPAPIYQITLRNGVMFEDGDDWEVRKRAHEYARAVHRLTGEYP